jgi:hypothetical protein
MSQKISAKNLQYNSTLPPFLARLRGEHPSGADRDGPDPILAGRRRAVKPRSGSAEAEDAPLVVDDQGNAVDVTVGADGTVKEKEKAEESTEPTQLDASPAEDTPAADASTRVEEKLADIGGQRKKRKINKIIGAEADEEDAEDNKGSRPKTDNAATTERKDDTGAAAKPKTKKKAKKVKLSFGDDEG